MGALVATVVGVVVVGGGGGVVVVVVVVVGGGGGLFNIPPESIEGLELFKIRI